MRSLYQTVMDYLWAHGVRPSLGYAVVERTPKRVYMIDGRPVSDYLSPEPVIAIPSSNYDCVLGYLARTNPEAAALLPDAACDTQRDGWWLTHQCRKRGLRYFKVRAPKVLRERGIEQVNAYPVELLRQRFEG